MKFTANQIADLLKGEILGDKDTEVHNLSKIEEGEVGSLTFLANPKYTPHIYSTKASIVIVNEDFVPEKAISPTLIKVPNAYSAFSTILDYYNSLKTNNTGVDSSSHISDSASYGLNCYIGAFAYIGVNVKLEMTLKSFLMSTLAIML